MLRDLFRATPQKCLENVEVWSGRSEGGQGRDRVGALIFKRCSLSKTLPIYRQISDQRGWKKQKPWRKIDLFLDGFHVFLHKRVLRVIWGPFVVVVVVQRHTSLCWWCFFYVQIFGIFSPKWLMPQSQLFCSLQQPHLEDWTIGRRGSGLYKRPALAQPLLNGEFPCVCRACGWNLL